MTLGAGLVGAGGACRLRGGLGFGRGLDVFPQPNTALNELDPRRLKGCANDFHGCGLQLFSPLKPRNGVGGQARRCG